MCLQMKSCYGTIGNLASDVSNKSINIVNKCDKPAVKQVNNFICDGFVTLDAFICFRYFNCSL